MKITDKQSIVKRSVVRWPALWLVIILLAGSCSDSILDEIDTNPNAPTDVPISQLLPRATMVAVYAISGGIGASGAAMFAEHTTNVRLNPLDPDDVEEHGWANAYSGLNDLNVMIEKAAGQQNFSYTGIGKTLFVYILSNTTDMYGDMPLTEGLNGSENRQPGFDSQEFIYNFMFDMLDEALDDLERPSIGNPGTADLIFGGDLDMWKKTAHGLRARLWNRLSEVDPQASATNALAAAALSFEAGEGFIFNQYLPGSLNDNPWTGHQKSQELFAVSQTTLDVMNAFTDPGVTDPRAERWFSRIEDELVGAPSGANVSDPAHIIYSAPSVQTVLYDEAPQPMLMYDEIKFIEAEAHLRLGDGNAANTAYEAAVRAALERGEIEAAGIDTYVGQGDVFPGEDNLTLEHIMKQKWISFWLFQATEAFNDVRRTGIPAMQNPNGQPLRLPYPESEITRNPNTPQDINIITIFTIPVWWDQ